jgi:hypothetical protein
MYATQVIPLVTKPVLLVMAAIYLKNKRMLSDKHRQLLKQLAKDSIEYGLFNQRSLIVDLSTMPEVLTEHRATFVTLEINNQLRGHWLKMLRLIVMLLLFQIPDFHLLKITN